MDESYNFLTRQLTDQNTDQPVNWFDRQLTKRATDPDNWLTGHLTQTTNYLKNWLTRQLTNWLVGQWLKSTVNKNIVSWEVSCFQLQLSDNIFISYSWRWEVKLFQTNNGLSDAVFTMRYSQPNLCKGKISKSVTLHWDRAFCPGQTL